MSEDLQDIVEIAELKELLLFFYEAVGVPLGVLDKNRQSLVTVGCQSICTEFHRSSPASREKCLQDTEQLLQRLDSADCLCLTCPLGLERVVFPLRLHDTLLGVFFLGQFLHAPADVDYFRRQAIAYGYDQAAYLQALGKVPIVPKERIDFLMTFFVRLLELLLRAGDENRRRRQAEEEVREVNRRLEVKVEERTEALNKALREVSDLVVQMDSMLHQVEQLAVTDTLTESFNRRKFDEVAVLEQQRVLRGKLPFSVIMLDIDRFKRVNDCYGHSVGDQVLKHLCDVVRRLIRTGDMLIRWGGEEFLIILPATQLDEAGPLAERIRVAVKQEHFPSVGQITVSLGVAQLRIEDSIDSLIQRVDQALYRAKQAGRDRMVFEAPAPEPTEDA